ncbi:hypothetical protein WDU94_014937 [Cyamophila willieti]
MYSYNRESYADKYRKYLPAIETEFDNYRQRDDTRLTSRYGTRYMTKNDTSLYGKNYAMSNLYDSKSERVLRTIKAVDEDVESLREWCAAHKTPKSEDNTEKTIEITIQEDKPCRNRCSKQRRPRTANGHASRRHRTASRQNLRRPQKTNEQDLQRPSTSTGHDRPNKKRNGSVSPYNRPSQSHDPGSPSNKQSRSQSPHRKPSHSHSLGSPSKESVDVLVNCCPTQLTNQMCPPRNRQSSSNQTCPPGNRQSSSNQMCAPKNRSSSPNQMCAPKNRSSSPNQMCSPKNRSSSPNQMCAPRNKSGGKSCHHHKRPRRKPQTTNCDGGFVQDCCDILSRSQSPGEGYSSDEHEKKRKFKRFRKGNKKEKDLDPKVECELMKIAECFERKREERLSQDPEEYMICLRKSKCKSRSREEKFKRKENSRGEKKKWRKKLRKNKSR